MKKNLLFLFLVVLLSVSIAHAEEYPFGNIISKDVACSSKYTNNRAALEATWPNKYAEVSHYKKI